MSGSQSTQYRLPAEWEAQEAVWIAWPHHVSDWSPKFSAIAWVYAELARLFAGSQTVRILVRDARQQAAATRALLQTDPGIFAPCGQALSDDACSGRLKGPAGDVEFFQTPTNRSWTRDFMPAFVTGCGQDAGKGAALHFRFDGWSRYPNHQADDAAGAFCARWVARQPGWEHVEVWQQERRVTLEGGALDVNGRGSILVSEECLLDAQTQVRNPGYGRADYEELFQTWFGCPNTLWLNRGIAGDDTHGHVDDFCRFVGPRTVVLCQEQDPSDPNHAALEENRERLEGLRLENGGSIEIVRLPMPRPVHFETLRLPASYANFFIANRLVAVPTFNDVADREALGILSELFPERVVVGVHARDLVLGLGTIHCLTHEQAALSAPGV